jgi:hypothetical protein
MAFVTLGRCDTITHKFTLNCNIAWCQQVLSPATRKQKHVEDAPKGKAFQALLVVENYLHPHRSAGRWKHGSMSQPEGQATVRAVTLVAFCQQDTCFRRTSFSLTTETSHGQSGTQRCCPDKSPH